MSESLFIALGLYPRKSIHPAKKSPSILGKLSCLLLVNAAQTVNLCCFLSCWVFVLNTLSFIKMWVEGVRGQGEVKRQLCVRGQVDIRGRVGVNGCKRSSEC